MSSFAKKAWDISLVHCIQTEDLKRAGQLKKVLTEDKTFGKMYMLVNNMERGIENDDSYDVDMFIQENRKIAKLLNLNAMQEGLDLDTEGMSLQYPILEHIDNILFNKVTPFNLSEITKSYNFVKTHLMEIRDKSKGNPLDVEKLEEQYQSLNEGDRTFLLEFYKTPSAEKETLFESKKNTVINKLKTILTEAKSNDERLLIFETKNQIEEMPYNDITYLQDLVNIYDLEKQIFTDENNGV